jgi:hypothetical protein
MQFTPETFSMLLESHRAWFALFHRLSQRRNVYPRGIEAEAVSLMLKDRNRQLRN